MKQLNELLGTSLIGVGGLSSELSEQLAAVLEHAHAMLYTPTETLEAVRQVLQRFEPLLAEHIADSSLAGWVHGYDAVASQFPIWLNREFATRVRNQPPAPPPEVSLFDMFGPEPSLRLPIIENAAKRLMERSIMTRDQFDAATSSAKEQAFEIAGGLTEDTIDKMRGFLVENLQEGTSLDGFSKLVVKHLGSSPIAPHHLENVYRTNVLSAVRDGKATLMANPVVAATFPYQAYHATHDRRTRPNHLALEKLGLNGTNIYRTDDPFWDHFTPPWDYQCRCFGQLLTLDQAARAGVKEAQDWLRTGRSPLEPEYRLAHIPFEPREGWGSRGNVGVVVMSLAQDVLRMAVYRAPHGYTVDHPLVINGKEYTGGQFIPGEDYQAADEHQKREIKSGKKLEAGEKPIDLARFHPTEDQQLVLIAVGKNGKSFPAGGDLLMTRHKRALTGLLQRGIIERKEEAGTITYSRAVTLAPLAQPNRVIEPPKPKAAMPEPAGAELQKSPEKQAPAKPPKPKRKTNEGNWHYASRDFFKGGLKAKYNANIEAIRTLKTLELEGREATREEQEKLSKYVGWGQFPQLFSYDFAPVTGDSYEERRKAANQRVEEYQKWQKERDELQALIGAEEFEAAKASTINAHYTHPDVVDAHWKMAERLGFKGGRYLEPAVGSGYYVGLMPEKLAANTTVTAVEKDLLTGNMAKHLYPSANVHVEPLQDVKTPDNFFDLVATNVPFADFRVHDPRYKRTRPNLHDYFFLRSIDAAKPGGLVMHLTSAGTMDKLNDRVRNKIAEDAEFVAALRFPGDAHKENAGTSVVTDMIILRKKNPAIPAVTDETPAEAEPKKPGFTGITIDSLGRLYHWKDGKRVPAPRWDDIVEVPDPDGKEPIPVNRYFAENPEQMLGRLDRSGSLYAGDQMNVSKTEDYEERLQAAIERLPEGAFWADKQPAKAEEPQPERVEVDASERYAEGQIIERDGQFFQHFNGALEPLSINKTDASRVSGQIRIRDAARKLIAAQQAGEPVDALRADLNDAYDQFTAKHGPLHSRPNRRAMKEDSDSAFLLALERYNSTDKTAAKADIFSRDTIRQVARADKAANIIDATGITLNEIGSMDVDRVATLLGKSREAVEEELIENGLAFRDPNGGKWVHAAEYLSGNVREKLRIAKAAAASDPSYAVNVKALEANQPEDIPYEDIGIRLGAPWAPTNVIAEFAADTLGARPDDFTVRYSSAGSIWDAKFANKSLSYRSSNLDVWGVRDEQETAVVDFEHILNAALTGKPITVRSAYADDNGNHPVLPEQTEAAREKVEDLKSRFKEWVWEDEQRREELSRFYNDNYNNIVPTHHDGSHLTFPGMKEDFKMRDMQKDFVWRVITTGKGLAAHEVGTGKTASMVAAAMELRRLGLAKKPVLACLKSNIEQITAEAQDLYPGAKILSTAEMFDAARRKKALNQIATGDYDLIVTTHDHLESLRMKPETVRQFIGEEIEELENAILESRENDIKEGKKSRDNRIVKQLEKRKQKLEESLKDALNQEAKDDIYFEDMGIDFVFVDEAHKFKTLPCVTSNQVKGVPTGRSQRATDMFAKTQWLMRKNNGRGVVFATGTPIANTMAELYNMQRYLQLDTLKERGLHKFDNWANTFGEITNNFEYKLNGDVKPTARFNEFVNLPELRHLASEFMDIQLAESQKKPDGSPLIVRPTKHENVVISPEYDGITDLMRDIQSRAEALKGKGRQATKGEDNMLTVCNDAKKGSIDLRLVNPDAEDHPDSKVNQCVRKVLELYHEHPGKVQAVFSDMGIHSDEDRISIFEDIRKKLVAGGIPEKEIANFSDSAMKDANRDEAQAAARRGDVRVLMGSTDRLGTGTNVQKKLLAMHHLDIPYVPAFIEQRDGRGWRHGNENKDVHIFRYVQHGSADNMFWQIVANKSNFINQYIRGSKARTMREMDAEELTPQEMVAVATGDAAAMERVTLEDEVRKLKRAANRHASDLAKFKQKIEDAPQARAALEQKLRDHQRDAEALKGRDFRMRIEGAGGFDERPEASKALDQVIEKAKQEFANLPSWDHRRRQPKRIGTYNGVANVNVRHDGFLELEGPSGQVYKAGPSLQSLEYTARNIAKRHAETQKALRDHEADMQKMHEAIGKPFKHTETLAEKEKRLEELKKKREAMKMSLQVGTQKVINGVTYILNPHHRWQLPQQQSPQKSQKPPEPTEGPQKTQPAQATQTPKQPSQAPQPQPQAAKPPAQEQIQQPGHHTATPSLGAQAPAPEVLALAASNGDSDAHRHARRHVAVHYLENVAKKYDHRTGQMVALDGTTARGMLDGIDLSKPVVMGPPPEIPPPDEMVQWQAKGGYRGAYYSVPGHEPEHLGIYNHATAWTLPGQPVLPREQTVYDTRSAKFNRMSYLQSTAAPTIDTWSVPGRPKQVSGGGIQWYIPTAAHPHVRVPKKHAPTASTASTGTPAGDRANPATAQTVA